MQRNFYTDERLSFHRPNAESTMNGTWSRKEFNNSAIPQNNRSAKSPQRCKVDARVYTDVQSRGLASRIVKYHENGTRFNRSSSLTNLSSKVNSPLSVKKLEAKPQLRYDRAVKQNVSMTHIAPPDKSLFYGNTLSGLLRSSSVITLHQNDDDLSSENRPIIHPPVTEKELQPTRSVLEVLKEISRKRINNEVLSDNDEIAETSKKYCGRVVDTAHLSAYEFRRQQMQALPQPATPTYKRQRESAVDGYVSSCLSRDVNPYQSKSPQPELAASPEQQSKRRHHCNYNNDITSSLSSSAKNATVKRKLYEHDGYMRQEKLFRYQSEARLPEISTASNYSNKLPITPLPNTPQTVSEEIPMPAVAVKKCASAPLPTVASPSETSSTAVKPKLTLFNRDYETKVDDEPSAKQTSLDSNEDDAYAGINFVKPKKSTTSIGGNTASNLVMQRTRKSKLALMLSGLRGELYLGDEEEEQRVKGLTTSKTNDDKPKDVPQQLVAPLPVSTPLTLTNTFDDKQKTGVVDKPDTSEKNSLPVVAVTSVATSITAPVPTTQPTKITSPLTGIKLTPIKSPTAHTATSNAQTALTFNFGATASTTAATVPKPILSFGAPTATSNATTTPSPNTTSFSFGLSTAATSTKPAPLLQFSAPATTSSPATVTSNPLLASTAGSSLNFNFGSTANSSQAATVTSAQSATVSSGFSLGKTATSNAASTTSTFTTTASATPAFSFGGLAATQAANKPLTTVPPAVQDNVKPATTAATFNFTSSKTTTSFNFGTSSSATVPTSTATEAPKMFSFSSSPKTLNPTTNVAFSFGNKNTTLDNKTAQPATLFGGANTQATTAPPTFGSQSADQAKNAASTSSFIFGAKPAPTGAPPAFGANTALAPAQENRNAPTNSFLFGSANPTQASKPTFGASTNNNNSSGSLFGLNTANSSTATPALATTNENAKPSNAFSFSNTATPAKAFNFGAANPTTNTVSDSSKSTNLFGGTLGNNQQSKAFSFGNPKGAASASEPAKPAASGSTFNFNNANQGNNSTFAFSGGNSNANNNKPTITNTFGAAAATNNNKPNTGAFSFAQSNNNTANSGIFNFNSSKNTNNSANVANQTSNTKPAGTTNTFGALSSNTSSSNGGFVFGANTKTATPTFGAVSSTSGPSTGLLFGAAQQQNNSTTTAATGNLFASISTPATAQSGNLFGGATSSSATSNIFGNNGNSTPVFGASAASSGTTTNNMFAIPASSGSERPIRRATRRLAKP